MTRKLFATLFFSFGCLGMLYTTADAVDEAPAPRLVQDKKDEGKKAEGKGKFGGFDKGKFGKFDPEKLKGFKGKFDPEKLKEFKGKFGGKGGFPGGKGKGEFGKGKGEFPGKGGFDKGKKKGDGEE